MSWSLVETARVARMLVTQVRRNARHERLVERWRRHGAHISDRALILMGDRSHLEIGVGSSIGSYTILDLTTDPHGATGAELFSTLIIGQHTAINEFNNIRAAGGTIRIGDHCLIAQFVSIVVSNHTIDTDGLIGETAWQTASNWVHVGDDVWIGTHAVILPGVRIGDGAVIGAGSVVTHDVAPRSIVAGVPASHRRWRNGDRSRLTIA